MAARPLLQLIAHLLAVRERAGGAVHWHHVKAHTQGADLDSVGNRLTDWQANRARVQPKVPQPLQLRELPLGACEPFLTVYQQPNTVRECQLIDDPRRCALAYLKATALSTWCARREAPEKVTQDGTLAGADMLDLSRIVLAAGSPAQQATLIHVATNSIQCAWVETADNPKPHVVALLCPNCVGLTCSLGHLAECAKGHATRFRTALRSDILAVLDSVPCTADWRRRHGGQDLQQILLRLFPIAASAPNDAKHQHFTRLLCGAFSARLANAAARLLGFPAEDGRLTLQRIRLACLDRIAQVFIDLKKVAAP